MLAIEDLFAWTFFDQVTRETKCRAIVICYYDFQCIFVSWTAASKHRENVYFNVFIKQGILLPFHCAIRIYYFCLPSAFYSFVRHPHFIIFVRPYVCPSVRPYSCFIPTLKPSLHIPALSLFGAVDAYIFLWIIWLLNC
jgi:hypothetical protein